MLRSAAVHSSLIRMGKRSKRRPKRSKNSSSRKNKDSGDWSDNMSGAVWKVLEYLPHAISAINAISAISEDGPTGSREGVEEALAAIVPEVRGQREVLESLARLLERSTEQHVQCQREFAEQLRGLFETYHRPDIYGQITAFFASAEAIKQIKRLADQAEKIASSVAGIEQNLQSVNARGDYFPIHVHSYVRMMIERHATDTVPHYFAVFNKGSQWHPKFSELERASPLGQQFVGYKTDLDELCAFLAEIVRPRVGPRAVLHILMPTIGPLAMAEAVKFPDAMRPFLVEGQLGDAGTPFVWLCTPEQNDRDCLRGIGVLKQREVYVMVGNVGIGLPIIGRWLTVPIEPRYFIDPGYRLNTLVGLILVNGAYMFWQLEPPRTLGQPTTRPW